MDAPSWIQPFLTALAGGSTVSEAASAAGIASTTAYGRRRTCADFAEAWANALEDSTDILEAAARSRAVQGVAEPVFWQGSVVGYRQVYSDALLALLLRGRRKLFATERTELTGADGAPVAVDATTRAARVAALLDTARQRQDLV